MSVTLLPEIKAPSRLKFTKQGFKYIVNDLKIQQFIEQGEQSFSFVVQLANSDMVLFSILEDNEYTDQRINIHKILANCKNVVRIIDYIKHIQIDLSSLNDNDKMKFNRISDGCTLVIYEYIPYNVLSFSTLDDGSSMYSHGINTQLVDKQKILNYFKNIMITIKDIHDHNVFHFDLKPENILGDQDNFIIIDFGSAQHIEQSSLDDKMPSILLPESSRVAFVVQTTEVFSPCKYDSQDGYIIADKYDVYSLGCILYHLLTNDYLAQPLAPQSPQFDLILLRYGPIVTDLIAGMTNRHILFRYTLKQALEHPAFCDECQLEFAEVNTFDVVNQPIIELSDEIHHGFDQSNQSYSHSEKQPGSHKQWSMVTASTQNLTKEQVLPDDLYKRLQMTYNMQLGQPAVDLGIRDSLSSDSFENTFQFKNIYSQLNQYWLNVILDTRKTYSDYIHKKISNRAKSQMPFQIQTNQNSLCDDCYVEQLKKILKKQLLKININSIMNHFNKQLTTIKSIRERNNLYKNLQDILASDIMQMFRFDREYEKFFNNDNIQLNRLQLKNLEAAATYQTMTRYNSDDSEDTDDNMLQLQADGNELMRDISNLKLFEKPKKRIMSASLKSRSIDSLKMSQPPSSNVSISESSQECISPPQVKPLETLDIFDFNVNCDTDIQYE